MGRPKINIEWDKVNKYLQAQCDGVSIAGLLGIAPITLYRACKRRFKVNFDAYSAKKKSEGVELLKLKQYQTAMSGNVTMQIWLGKQYAGQREKSELTGADGKDLIPPARTLTKEEAKQFIKDVESEY